VLYLKDTLDITRSQVALSCTGGVSVLAHASMV